VIENGENPLTMKRREGEEKLQHSETLEVWIKHPIP
jgi:hypothetical protein